MMEVLYDFLQPWIDSGFVAMTHPRNSRACKQRYDVKEKRPLPAGQQGNKCGDMKVRGLPWIPGRVLTVQHGGDRGAGKICVSSGLAFWSPERPRAFAT